jgi:hypothetical protein
VDAVDAGSLAEFMLRSLYGSYLGSPDARFKFNAPLVKTAPDEDVCEPTS